MIIKFEKNANEQEVTQLLNALRKRDFLIKDASSESQKLVGVIGDTAILDTKQFEAYDVVESVIRIQEPYKLASRSFHSNDTKIKVGNHIIGEGSFTIIGGPCAVESEAHIVEMAHLVQKAGGHMLRGGAFKPRTSPYSFQGLGREGVHFMKKASHETGLPIVTEIISDEEIDFFNEHVDVIQVGARNMQNFKLLKALSEINKPVILKRGMSATIKEWILAAEYIMSGGNEQVILCERGIRTFETETRNTLDISTIPIIKKMTHLPIIIDPSHSGGHWWMVESLSKAAIAAGADGIIVEAHSNPKEAASDGSQSLKPEKFEDLVKEMKFLADALGKVVQ